LRDAHIRQIFQASGLHCIDCGGALSGMIRWGACGPVAAMSLLAWGTLAYGAYDDLIAKHALANQVPERLVRRIIRIESRGNAHAIHRGNYGLMQIRLGTARALGYEGSPNGLLDADTNMKYAVKYLAGAYRAAGCNDDRAVALYQRGYYGTKPATCGVAAVIANGKPEAPAARPEPDFELAQARPAPVTLKPKVVHTVAVPAFVAATAEAPQPYPAPEAVVSPTPAAVPAVVATPAAVATPEATPTPKVASPAVAPSPVVALLPIAAPAPAPKPDTFAARVSLTPLEEPATTGARPGAEPELISSPQVKTSDPVPTVKHEKRRTHRAAKRYVMVAREAAPAAPAGRAGNEDASSGGLMSLLKKLVTPEQPKPVFRHHRSRAERQAQR
jgi:hypothetical protein